MVSQPGQSYPFLRANGDFRGDKAPPMSVMPADNGRGPLTGSSSPAEVRCIDRPKHADHCGEWQSQGQCKGNPLFMHWACPKSCSGCTLQVKNGRVVPRGKGEGQQKLPTKRLRPTHSHPLNHYGRQIRLLSGWRRPISLQRLMSWMFITSRN